MILAPIGPTPINSLVSITGGTTTAGGGPFGVSNKTASAAGLRGDGTDDGPKLNDAIAALSAAGGGTLSLDPTKSYHFSTPLDFRNLHNVTLTTGSGREAIAYDAPQQATLIWDGSGSTAPIQLAHAQTIKFLGLGLRYSSTSFTGVYLDFGPDDISSDTAYVTFENCAFGGTISTAKNCSALAHLDHSIIVTFKECTFEFADVAIYGAATLYANAVTVERCTFRQLNNFSVYNAGQGWNVLNCTFEANIGNRCTFFGDDGIGTAKGVNIMGCWLGDVNLGTDSAINCKFFNGNIIGNYFGINATGATAITFKTGTQGAVVMGNRIECSNGIDSEGAYAYGVSLIGNSWQVTTHIANPNNFANGQVVGDPDLPCGMFGVNQGISIKDQSEVIPDTSRDVIQLGSTSNPHLALFRGSAGAYFLRVSSATLDYNQYDLVVCPPNAPSGGTGRFVVATGNDFGTLLIPRFVANHGSVGVGSGPVSSAWNGDHLVMGSYHFWVDGSDRLRVKSSAPTSDTDGTIVGTQS